MHSKHNGYRLNQFALQADIATSDEIMDLKGGNNALSSALRKVGLVKRKSYFKKNIAHILMKVFLKVTVFT